MRKRSRLIVPLTLLVLGIGLLVGCITIPATRQLQPDFKRRPEYLIGDVPDKPVHIGQTTFADAYLKLTPAIGTMVYDQGWGSTVTSNRPLSQWSIINWTATPDRRQFAISYQIRTATDVYPLCFMAHARAENRWLVLSVNDAGVVTATNTTSEPVAGMDQIPVDDWLVIFDESQRRRLQADGLLPPDELLAQAGKLQREHAKRSEEQRAQRRRAAQERTTQPISN